MAGPAVLCGMLCRPFFRAGRRRRAIASFACGAGAVLLSALLCALALSLSGDAFRSAARIIFLAHIPIMLIEGFLTMGIIGYLHKTLPELLTGTRPEGGRAGGPLRSPEPSAGDQAGTRPEDARADDL
jgi:cobalt/nickel transport system permease protein